ncbi:invasion associated locus B family protein [Albidovulum sp.]
MKPTSRLLALPVILALAAPALAQQNDSAQTGTAPAADGQAAGEAPAPAAPAAAPDGIGEPYVAETHGDWQVRCIRTADGADPCQLYQLLLEPESQKPFAEISLVTLEGVKEAVAGATIIVPLETLLTQPLSLVVDGGQARRYPYVFCADIGCYARAGLTAADIEAFKKGKVATLTVVPAAKPDQKVSVNVSLKGFTAGYEAVAKLNAAGR